MWCGSTEILSWWSRDCSNRGGRPKRVELSKQSWIDCRARSTGQRLYGRIRNASSNGIFIEMMLLLQIIFSVVRRILIWLFPHHIPFMWEFVTLRQFIPVDPPLSSSSDLFTVFTKSCIHHGIPFLCVRLGKVHTVTNVSMKPFPS